LLLELPEFDWIPVSTVQETCALLAQYGEDTLALAGGTDLFTKMKQRRLVPRRLIDIKKIPGLDQIRHDERQGLRIGALATAQAIESSAVIANRFPAIKQAASALGTLQIRNTATLGGNLANASPSAEFAPPLLALGASVQCVGSSAARLIPLGEFFVAPGKTVLGKDELITEVRVPNQPAGARAIYLKHSLRKMDVAIASAAVFLVLDGDHCTDARIALGAVGPVPFRAPQAEAAIKGQRLAGGRSAGELLEQVARLASEESVPIDDLRAYAGYRRKLVAMLVGKALERLVVRRQA
jgi:carbon-monoxide dehydrogenase medium subunit